MQIRDRRISRVVVAAVQHAGDFPLTAPLRVASVHDQHVAAERVVQVAREQCGEGRLSDANSLIADGDA